MALSSTQTIQAFFYFPISVLLAKTERTGNDQRGPGNWVQGDPPRSVFWTLTTLRVGRALIGNHFGRQTNQVHPLHIESLEKAGLASLPLANGCGDPQARTLGVPSLTWENRQTQGLSVQNQGTRRSENRCHSRRRLEGRLYNCRLKFKFQWFARWMLPQTIHSQVPDVCGVQLPEQGSLVLWVALQTGTNW